MPRSRFMLQVACLQVGMYPHVHLCSLSIPKFDHS